MRVPALLLGLLLGLLGPVPAAPAAPAVPAPAAEPLTISVMSFNILYGADEVDLATGDWCPVADGCPQGLRKVARIIRTSGADVVGLQEAERNTRPLARLLGWYADPRAQVVSRFPILRPAGGRGLFTYVEPAPGRVVAVANTHLPSSPYGPYRVQRGRSLEQVLALEQRLRVPALDRVLPVLGRVVARGVPVFLTGDFNSPSHLDWTQAVADARPEVPYAVRWPASARLADAGFVDSYRAVHPDPVAAPGYTWTPGGPEGRKDEFFDRIDWVLAAGPATAVASRLVGETGNPQVDVATRGRFPSDHRGVVSTFSVQAPEAPVSVSPAERRVYAGDALRVRFHGSGTVAITSGDEVLVRRSTSGRTSGALVVPTSALAPGRYDVELRSGGTTARSPIWVYERGTPARLRTDAASYAPGEPIRVSWTGAPGEHLDWIGLYRCERSCDDPGGYLAYRYTATRIEGSLVLSDEVLPGEVAPQWPLPPGEYVARLLVDDSYRVAAQSARFRVTPLVEEVAQQPSRSQRRADAVPATATLAPEAAH